MSAAPHITFDAHGNHAWTQVLESIGLHSGRDASVEIESGRDPAYWLKRANDGAIIITEGASPLAKTLGITTIDKTTEIRSLTDESDPSLEVVWQRPIQIPIFQLPPTAKVFLRERRTQAPVMAGLRQGSGAILWTATPIGDEGYERYPSIPQALLALGLNPPLRSNRLWAFFDSSYRTRVDVDYFAERWRKAGIGALHIAAWHYWEPDPERDAYLARLIEACHRRAIVVYAWLEFPHVSEAFWNAHPEWREQTAAQQDAHLDWRKLMNLLDPDCEREVWRATQSLMRRFDWDGVNVAELYFESLEGAANPARFTPMNALVRKRYQHDTGLDPIDLITKPNANTQAFLNWRAARARELQETWLTKLETLRTEHPGVDIVLTHVDDRFDDRMRDRVGADSAAALQSLNRHDFTFLVEDPATIWNLGPRRYPEIAKRYLAINPRPSALAVDINVVERYQDVYPTKRQVGAELTQLVHAAAQAFPRVALYFENSIRSFDYPALPLSAATGTAESTPTGLVVSSEQGTSVNWQGAMLLDGKPWPITNDNIAQLPAGQHTIEPAAASSMPRIVDLSGEITHASTNNNSMEFAYRSQSRTYAIIDRKPTLIEVDSEESSAGLTPMDAHWLLRLPRGQHVVTLRFEQEGGRPVRTGPQVP